MEKKHNYGKSAHLCMIFPATNLHLVRGYNQLELLYSWNFPKGNPIVNQENQQLNHNIAMENRPIKISNYRQDGAPQL